MGAAPRSPSTLDDLKCAQEVFGAVRLGDTGVAGGQFDGLVDIPALIENAEAATVAQLRDNFGAKAAVSQSDVNDGKVGTNCATERNTLRNRAGDAADLISGADKGFCDRVRHHQVIFGNQDFKHTSPPNHETGWQDHHTRAVARPYWRRYLPLAAWPFGTLPSCFW
jgi:hypothetical protein